MQVSLKALPRSFSRNFSKSLSIVDDETQEKIEKYFSSVDDFLLNTEKFEDYLDDVPNTAPEKGLLKGFATVKGT